MIDPMRRRAALTLTAIGLAAALLLAAVDQLTRATIADQEQQRALAILSRMLPADSFNNNLVNDRIFLEIPGLDVPARAYRARMDGEPTAILFDVVTNRGYSGDIRLLVAAAPDGEVLGVRVIDHRETPGLGDRIEIERSAWIRQFTGRSLNDPPTERWASNRRGGDFDSMTSATITAEAVIGAVRSTLIGLDQAEQDTLWRSTPGTGPEPEPEGPGLPLPGETSGSG